MKGLILSGGSGKRLRPLTHTGAKQLVPVANRPILFYVVDKLVDAGVCDIGVVLSPETGNEVQQALGDGSRFGARFTYLLQEKPLGIAHAVMIARDFLGDEPFVLYLGDNLIGMSIGEKLRKFLSTPEIAASLMLKKVSNPSSFGVAEVNRQGKVIGLEEKPQVPKSDLALVGVYLFRAPIHKTICTIQPSPRGELEITDAINSLLLQGLAVDFEELNGWWLDTGKKDDILQANDKVLLEWRKPHVEGHIEQSSLMGKVNVAEGASVIRSVLQGPVIIGKNAEVVDSHIGPFTSLGDGVCVRKSKVERSIIMENSSIQGIPRLKDALVGRRVHVRGSNHDSLSLMVGDDCVVQLPVEREHGLDSNPLDIEL
jgi:glucose-1-phosphate thymidylyltransferase